MKIVNVIGGLGNQLFQYAFYLALKEKYGENTKLDILNFEDYNLHNGYELERIFLVDADYCSQEEKDATYVKARGFLKKLQQKFLSNEKTGISERRRHELSFEKKLLGSPNTNLYYKGYWQSYKYFSAIEDIIKDKLVFPKITDKSNKAFLGSIKDKETVSIHIRRGDYINHPLLGGICELDYYLNAINVIKSKVKNPLFIIFSNDIQWCKNNLKLDNVQFVDWNNDSQSFIDMQLMSLCNHNIIANSSFSWWAAWLNQNKNKIVISPNKWMKNKTTGDLIPDEWIKIVIDSK